jgi:ethanolamine ammonia-lyase large subunit
MDFGHVIGGIRHRFANLSELMARATPFRSGDALAGVAASSAEERVAAQYALADLPLKHFLEDQLIPYESDEVTRLIVDTHDPIAFAPVASLTVGEFRDWLLSEDATGERLAELSPGLTPEMVAAVSKLMRIQDLILIAAKIRVVTCFRTTVGLPGRLSTRLQPNHPTDDAAGIAASMLDGLLLGSGDAVIGINPVSDNPATVTRLLRMIDTVRERFSIPAQNCVLSHITTQIAAIEQGAPLDLLFQSIAGTEAANTSFGINLALLKEGHEAAQSLTSRRCLRRRQRGPQRDVL